MTVQRNKFFFVHVMKTAGTTFFHHCVARNFRQEEIYPDPRVDPVADVTQSAYWRLDYLLSLPPERRASIRIYAGHFPFVASELVGGDLVTLAILREPVARTISYLKHCKQHHDEHRSLTLEEIYEDPQFFRSFIKDHQTKIFSMTADDHPTSFMDVIEVNEHRLDLAKANLVKVDVLGLHERFDEFPTELQRRYGWSDGTVGRRRVGEPYEASSELLRRIADENACDMALYEFARNLCSERRRANPQ